MQERERESVKERRRRRREGLCGRRRACLGGGSGGDGERQQRGLQLKFSFSSDSTNLINPSLARSNTFLVMKRQYTHLLRTLFIC